MEDKKVGLVFVGQDRFSYTDKPDWNNEHLSINYLASSLQKKQICVDIFDIASGNSSIDDLFSAISTNDYPLMGFSITCTNIQGTIKIINEIKGIKPSIHITLGGHHATHCAVEILENEKNVDSIVRGDGEITIIELAQAIINGFALSGIDGVFYKKSGRIIKNKDRIACQNLDIIPFPSRKTIVDNDSNFAMLSSSRGCIYSCSFCSTPEFYKIQNQRDWRFRSAENVVTELEELYFKYNIKNVEIVDDNFVINRQDSKQRLWQILTLILKKEIKQKYWIMCGVNTFSKEDDELLKLMYLAGIRQIALGIESGTESSLALYRKPASPQKNISAIELLSSYKFAILCPYILFHPLITVEDLLKEIDFIFRILSIDEVGMLSSYCTRLYLYPGIKIFEKIRDEGLLKDNPVYMSPLNYSFKNHLIQEIWDVIDEFSFRQSELDWRIWDIRSLILLLQGIPKEELDILISYKYKINEIIKTNNVLIREIIMNIKSIELYEIKNKYNEFLKKSIIKSNQIFEIIQNMLIEGEKVYL